MRAIRGANTIINDTPDEIKHATVEMLSEIISTNNILIENIVCAEFTITEDIKSATPAKFARTELGWDTVPLMCYREFEFDGGLKKCIRVMLLVNSSKTQKDIKHIYLNEAKKLRPDLTK